MIGGRWRIHKDGPKRWKVTCPTDHANFGWDNDFGRGGCACRYFRKWSLARNFVFKRNGAK